MSRGPAAARLALLLALVVAVALAGCGGDVGTDGERTASPVSRRQAALAVTALCAMRTAEDHEEAMERFENDAHATLHAVGDAVRERDAALAGRLLRAKSRVESRLATGASPDAMRPDVEALADATVAALGELGVDVPACPD
jgi:ABC-type glycerol-3-phosphate transport system substrate-binding protein